MKIDTKNKEMNPIRFENVFKDFNLVSSYPAKFKKSDIYRACFIPNGKKEFFDVVRDSLRDYSYINDQGESFSTYSIVEHLVEKLPKEKRDFYKENFPKSNTNRYVVGDSLVSEVTKLAYNTTIKILIEEWKIKNLSFEIKNNFLSYFTFAHEYENETNNYLVFIDESTRCLSFEKLTVSDFNPKKEFFSELEISLNDKYPNIRLDLFIQNSTTPNTLLSDVILEIYKKTTEYRLKNLFN